MPVLNWLWTVFPTPDFVHVHVSNNVCAMTCLDCTSLLCAVSFSLLNNYWYNVVCSVLIYQVYCYSWCQNNAFLWRGPRPMILRHINPIPVSQIHYAIQISIILVPVCTVLSLCLGREPNAVQAESIAALGFKLSLGDTFYIRGKVNSRWTVSGCSGGEAAGPSPWTVADQLTA